LSIADYISDNWFEGKMGGVSTDIYNKLNIVTHDYSSWTPTNIASWCKYGSVYALAANNQANAFNYDSTYWSAGDASGTIYRWITYIFPTPVCVNTISVIAHSYITGYNNFEVYASNTPRENAKSHDYRFIQEETLLFSETSISCTPNQRTTRTFENDTKYRCYTFQAKIASTSNQYIYLIEFYNTNSSTYESKIFENTYPPHTYLNIDVVNTDNTIVTKK